MTIRLPLPRCGGPNREYVVCGRGKENAPRQRFRVIGPHVHADRHAPLFNFRPLPTSSSKQTSAQVQAVETIICTFLPTEPPEPPPCDERATGSSGAAAGSAVAAGVSPSVADCKHGEVRSAAVAARASDTPGSARGANLLQQRRSSSLKAGTGLGGATPISGGDVGRGDGGGAGDSGTFWDEDGAGGAGLVISSPVDLERILPPQSFSGALFTTSVTTGDSPYSVAAMMAAGNVTGGAGGGGTGSGSSVVPGMTPSRCSTGSGGGGATAAGNSDDRLWLVYDGASAAGKGVLSRVNAPNPYWLGRASPGAMCPHAHSMAFHSAFEGANLLRAVQVCEFVQDPKWVRL